MESFRRTTQQILKKMTCPFCKKVEKRKLASNQYAFVIRDSYPVTKFHSLIIPKSHKKNYFDLTKEEMNSCYELLIAEKESLKKLDSSIKGFNIGINIGKVAGQTIDHAHIHLIPRRQGDIKDPSGGVRGVIPEKQKY